MCDNRSERVSASVRVSCMWCIWCIWCVVACRDGVRRVCVAWCVSCGVVYDVLFALF